LTHFPFAQPRPEEDEGEKKDVTAQAHRLNRVVLHGDKEEQQRPDHQDADPQPQRRQSSTVCAWRFFRELCDVEADDRRVEDEVGVSLRQVGPQDAVEVADPDDAHQPGDERAAPGEVSENEGGGTEDY
jgi:hypothetical protein